ncbi:restriction endonuclease [Streptomyces sp. TRM 70361]|uniref:restriction endonuclease n=1 Tax=Streptomyces sp. TRM 70361 TaxID=3116553 RepID=UPI002E7B7DDD|nr:restriction endonuclease [Streptomyces sp. TRM 70361]MEE1943084.1 restriction endonuclease [Streptomyces sp. TRM 70361]
MSGRRPARRSSPRKRRPARRRQQGNDLLTVLAVGAMALAVVGAVVRWLLENWWLLMLLAAAAASVGGALWHTRSQRARWERVRAQGLRYRLAQLDALHYDAFEYAVRDLMRRDGCADAQKLGGRGDNGCDVLATDPFGRRWVIQCKHRSKGLAGAAVGTPDLQVLNGTGRPVHRGDVVVLVTNGRFSAPARDFGKQQQLHLVDRKLLGQWAAGSRPLWELLDRIPPPRRATPRS